MSVMDEFRLDGDVALVTGGASGIGRACCQAVAEAGADVAVADVDEEGARETAEEIEDATDSTTLPVEVDVRRREVVDEMVEDTVEELGSLDVAFANAGVAELEPSVEQYDEATWDRVMDVNLRGVFLTNRAAAEQMKQQDDGGVIVNTSSIYAFVADRTLGLPAYTASKAGIRQLTQAMATKLAPEIRVNAMAPGAVRTNIGAGFMKEGSGFDEVQEMIRERTLLDRLAEPEDVKGLAVYLASDASSYCTGYTYAVDGGWLSV